MELLIISGMSGGGKSKASGVLEDMDYYCVDNLPVSLIPKFTELCFSGRGYEHVALVTDIRSQENFDQLFDVIRELDGMGVSHRILYMEASTDIIIKRYKETRRRHPLMRGGSTISDAVEREKKLLQPVRDMADYVIDTSTLTLGQMQMKVRELFTSNKGAGQFPVNVISFGFKHGVPLDGDLVFDVRFLPNPYYVGELKNLRGTDVPVRDYVFQFDLTHEFMKKLCDMISFLIPNYVEEGKNSLVICIGCTGGHHRSVAIAQALTEYLQEKGCCANCVHRDVNK